MLFVIKFCLLFYANDYGKILCLLDLSQCKFSQMMQRLLATLHTHPSLHCIYCMHCRQEEQKEMLWIMKERRGKQW